MPEPGDPDCFLVLIKSVNNAILPVQDLAGYSVGELGHKMPALRQVFERQGRINQGVTEPFGRLGIIERDVADNLAEVLDSPGRQDYFTIHEGTISRTFSAATPSPRSNCSKPSRTPAINSISRAIS